VLVFLIIRQTVQRAHNVWASAIPIVIIGGLEAGWGLVSGEEPISGTYFNKNHFAGLLEMSLPLALMYAVAIARRPPERRGHFAASAITAACALAAAILMFAAIGLSLSKAGFSSMIGALLLLSLAAVAARVRKGKRWAIVILSVVVAVVGFLFLSPEALVRQFGTIGADETGEGRVPLAMDTLRLIAAFPMFGSGLGTYYPALLRYQTSALDFVVTNAHNDYLQLLSELGLAGSLILVSFLGAALSHAWRMSAASPVREARFLGLACLGSLAGLLLHSVADFNLYVPANAMVASWVAGIASGLPGAPRNQPTRGPASFLRASMLGFGGLAIAYSALVSTYFYWYQDNPRAERLFCRFGVCDSYSALSAIQADHGGDLSAVPRSDLLEFLSRDPANPSRWEDLGDSLQKAGDTALASRCFQRAVALGPRIPSTLFRAARFHFELDEKELALDLMSRTLKGNPGFSDQVFSEYDRVGVATSDVVLHGLPDDATIWRSYLRRQLKTDPEVSAAAPTPADVVWEAVVRGKYADETLANEYVEFILRSRGPEAALESWARFKEHDFVRDRIFNGDFESDPTHVRFDWRLDPVSGVAVEFDRTVAYHGQRSLRLRFDGSANMGELGVQQQVYLPPGTFRLRAYVRTSDITTDQGIFIRVVNVEGPGTLEAVTTSLRGSNDWTLLETVFEAPLKGGLVRVGPARKRSLKFDNLVRGIAWVDHVSITAEAPVRR
jgi:O-antigen ligase